MVIPSHISRFLGAPMDFAGHYKRGVIGKMPSDIFALTPLIATCIIFLYHGGTPSMTSQEVNAAIRQSLGPPAKLLY